MPRNGNGSKRGNAGGGSVPRWVRTLFNQHEARMDAQRAKDSKALADALRDVRGRVDRLEPK